MDLPKTPDTDATGNIAVTYCELAFERKKWIFRRQDGQNDFGIDAEIEIVEKNFVTGHILKGQVKGQAETKWENNGYVLVPVDVSTYNLWKATPLPVIALLCDVSTQSIYWNLPIAHVPKPGADSVSLRFEKDQSLANSFDVLEALLRSWFTTFSRENILREVPYFYEFFKEMRDSAGWGDAWMPLDVDLDIKCRLFYHHVIELRLGLGLSCVELRPIDDWYIRSAATWDDESNLFWGTFEELYFFVEPYYNEAFEKLRLRAGRAESRFENQELRKFLAKLDNKLQATYLDPRIESRTFAQDFDELLEKRGVLKHRQVKK